MFKLHSDFKPGGDQPQAIKKLTEDITDGKKDNILLGVTGSGKTFTIANIIANLNRPALVLAHNKTLAAQLCNEFREFFPENHVEYFISYYDYYQPEAYIARRDIYIEKEAQINEEIERLRHSATRALLSRRDVIIVASVSCIYGLGKPEEYTQGVIPIKVGDQLNRRQFLLKLDTIQYERNDVELKRGRYRIKGDTLDIFPSWEENVLRIEFFGDEIDRLIWLHPVSGETLYEVSEIDLYPATHYVVSKQLETAIANIRQELQEQVAYFKSQEKLLEAARIEQRTNYDLDMMAEIGYCKGIENYSRHISGTAPGEHPGALLDFFPDDYLTIIDESHVTLPQVRGMYNGDRSRKQSLVDYGFRLPSALDNRPLKFDEFEEKTGQTIYVSATPGPYELEKVKDPTKKRDDMWNNYDIAEQIIRPTGLVDPQITIKGTVGQVDDLIDEVQTVIKRNERVLVTTLTKQMSEDLTQFLEDKNLKVCYLHSEIHALDRIDILHNLRKGVYDILIGVNLLREGLDLPEVSLVAIMDADKEGFLRNERSLIQTMGRAARNSNGRVILYADVYTDSMKRAVEETNRRREKQLAFNKKHNILPKTIFKKLTDIRSENRDKLKELDAKVASSVTAEKLPEVLAQLQKDMTEAAENLEFELAAVLRDQIEKLKNMN